jgi:protocatechuate 3,4-dioxygenase beta subunit
VVVTARRSIAVAAAAVVIAACWLGRDALRGSHASARDGDRAPARVAIAASPHAVEVPHLLPIVPGALRLEGQVVGADQQPAGGVLVTLGEQRTTTTELDGSFAFDGLAAGSYAVTAEHGAWYADDRDVTLDATSDPVVLELARGPTLIVRVTDATGAPLAGAEVESSSRGAKTGRDGLARLRAIDSDSTNLTVSAEGHAPYTEHLDTGDDPDATIERDVVLGSGARLAGTVVDETGKPVPRALAEVENAEAGRSEVIMCDDDGGWNIADAARGHYVLRATSQDRAAAPDLAIDTDGVHAREGVVLHVVMGAALRGLVVDERGAPVAHADVVLDWKSTTTDDAGRFSVTGLAPGELDVMAHTARAGSPSTKLTIARDGRADVRLVVQPSSLAGIVVDPAGAPVEGVRVTATSDDPHGIGSDRTDAHGRFDLGGLPPGRYELEVHHDDEQLRTNASAITATTERRDLRLVLPELASIGGRVVLDGQPVPYFGFVVEADAHTIASDTPNPVRDAGGRFVQRGVEPGTWAVAIVGPGFATRTLEGVRVTAGAATDLGDIAVERGRVVRGHVRDETGAPVAGATVTIRSDSGLDSGLRGLLAGTSTARSDTTGAFELAGLGPASDQSRRIDATHPTRGSSPARTLAETETDVDLVVAAGGEIAGTFTSSRAMFRPYAATATLGEVTYTTQLEHDGGFRFTELPPGVYDVSIGGGRTGPPAQVVVTAGSHVSLAFVEPTADP